MAQRFPTFEIDEPQRELRVGGRACTLQPRVFDLLVYLAKNRDRVVPKDELLDAVWPDVTVADGSLQRAVSLLRAELGQAGEIRTFSRRGYRLCVPEASVAEAEAALLSPLEWHRWAHHVQSSGKNGKKIEPLEAEVTGLPRHGDKRRAAWAAVLLAQIRMEWGDVALAQGWYHRARRLLEDAPRGREQGYLDMLGSRMAVLEGDFALAFSLAASARAIGGKTGDADLETFGLVLEGEAHILLGRTGEGLAALDEAGAAVSAGGLSAWAGGLVFCGLIYMCMTRSDWGRATEWTEQFTRWGGDKGASSYPGLCRLHHAEILTVRGEVARAEREIHAAREALAVQAPWSEGEAWRALGETLLAKGDYKAAHRALARSMEFGWDAQFEIALVRIAEGDAKGAADLLARAIAENSYSCRARRGRALAHLAIAAARAKRTGEARAALAEIDKAPELVSTSALKALVLGARAEVAAAENRRGEAIVRLRESLQQWLKIGAPLPAAHARGRLAMWLAAEGEHEFAKVELSAAKKIFRESGAMAAFHAYNLNRV